MAVLSEFLSLDEVTYMPLEELVNFIAEKSKNHFVDPKHTAKLLKKAARDSYRLDKKLYEPINTAIESSFTIIKSIEKQLKVTNKAIIKVIKGFNTTEYQSLISILGVGKVLAAGILAEISSIKFFDSNYKLAKLACLIFALLSNNRIYSIDYVGSKTNK